MPEKREWDIEELFPKPRKMGPLPADHPSVGDACSACPVQIKEGDYVTLVPLGPGQDPEEQQKCRENRPYNAVAALCHYTCVTGEVE